MAAVYSFLPPSFLSRHESLSQGLFPPPGRLVIYTVPRVNPQNNPFFASGTYYQKPHWGPLDRWLSHSRNIASYRQGPRAAGNLRPNPWAAYYERSER